MIFCLAVFRSRTETHKFIDYMNGRGIYTVAVNTPSEAKIGCGICAKFPYSFLGYARDVVKKAGYSTFNGFYLVENRFGGNVTRYLG